MFKLCKMAKNSEMGITGHGIKTRRNTFFQRPLAFSTEVKIGKEHSVKLWGGIKVLCSFSVFKNLEICARIQQGWHSFKKKRLERVGKSLTLMKQLLFFHGRAINCSLLRRFFSPTPVSVFISYLYY